MLRRTGRGRGSAVLAAAVVVLAALVLLPDRLGLDRWLPFAAFAALRPALVAGAAGALVVAGLVLVRRRRRGPARAGVVAMLLVTVVAAAAAAPLADRVIAGPSPPPTGTELSVLTLNVFQGRADPDVLAELVRRERPDLVVLPEAGERYRALMAARLPSYRSWTNVPPRARDVRGIVVLAAPRAGDVRAERLADGTRYPWVEVRGGRLGGTRLIGVHLVSPVPGWIGYWPGELRSLQRWCAGDAPALIVGDLNATPDHSAFRAGTRGCSDTAAERGTGLTATWPTAAPRGLGARIDHVLATGGPVARTVRVLDVPGTDHRAVLAVLRL